MTEEKLQYIKSITIKKLWGKVNIDWQLDPKVNILVGKNGTGKSTILNIIESIITEKPINLLFEVESLQIKFNSEKYISLKITDNPSDLTNYFISEIEKAKEKKDSYNLIKYKNLLDSLIENGMSNKGFTISNNLVESENKDQTETDIKFSKFIKLFNVSTFELLINDIKHRNRKYLNSDGLTELDIILNDLIDDFKSYQLTLRKLIESKILLLDNEIKALSSQESVTNEELIKLRELLKQKDDITANINHTKNVFLDLVNQLFSETNKKIDFDENNSIIFQKPDNQIISTYQLSSGEKQILIILLTVVIQQNKPCILLMDEPELSLHLSWQHKLIDMIQLLNNNCQLIIVTHAAGIFSKGWMDKVIKMDNIINH